MPNKVKIQLPGGGDWVNATPVQINQSNEQWNTYLLEDGSVLKVKLVVTKVLRLDDSYDVEGNPVYRFQSTNIPSVLAPEELRKKG